MKRFPVIFKIFTAVLSVFYLSSCEKDYYYETPPPHVPQATSTLEAARVTSPPSALNSSYWKNADFLEVTAGNISTSRLYGDGFLNMTGTFLGLPDFNNGANAKLTLRAAYDNDNLYILAEWSDSVIDASNSSWLYNGPLDPRKADAANGWTSQRNGDNISFAFDIDNASSPAGTFANVGCAASCHTSGGNAFMYPTGGKVDIWNWSLARTNPLGYAADLIANSDSFAADNGDRIYYRNSVGTTARSGPAFEWDGTPQSVPGKSNLDPAFYILNKTGFSGDAQNGYTIYHRPTPPGDCESCHGANGTGGSAQALNYIDFNRDSRADLYSKMDLVPDMVSYWGGLTASEKNDVVAYLRGLSGVPGYYLSTPTGSNADISVVSNVSSQNLNDALLSKSKSHTYQVLITRKLNTNNPDDMKFDLAIQKTYKFGVAIMDNDGINHIGSVIETLTFK